MCSCKKYFEHIKSQFKYFTMMMIYLKIQKFTLVPKIGHFGSQKEPKNCFFASITSKKTIFWKDMTKENYMNGPFKVLQKYFRQNHEDFGPSGGKNRPQNWLKIHFFANFLKNRLGL